MLIKNIVFPSIQINLLYQHQYKDAWQNIKTTVLSHKFEVRGTRDFILKY